MSEQSFRFQEGTSDKFWTIKLQGSSYTVHFGRVGTAGQVQTKDFGSETEAKGQYEKIIAEKLKKGYVQLESAASLTSNQSELTAAAVQAAAKAPVLLKTREEETAVSHPVAQNSVPAATTGPLAAASSLQSIVAKNEAVAPSRESIFATGLQTERTVSLSPIEWLYNFHLRQGPFAKPPEQPFDLAGALHTASQMDFKHLSFVTEIWRRQAITPWHWTKEEAHFWLCALSSAEVTARQSLKLAPDWRAHFRGLMTARKFSGKVSESEVQEMLWAVKSYADFRLHCIMPLIRLFSPAEVVRIACDKLAPFPHIRSAIRQYSIGYASDRELDEVRNFLRGRIGRKSWKEIESAPTMNPALYFAGMLGMHELVGPIIESIPDRHFESNWDAMLKAISNGLVWLLYALNDSQLIAHHFKRTCMPMVKPVDMYQLSFEQDECEFTAWIANTQWKHLDALKKPIMTARNKEDAGYIMRVLTKVEAPEAAALVLECYARSKAPSDARKWLERHPEWTLCAIAEIIDEPGMLGDFGRRFAKDFIKKCDFDSLAAGVKKKLAPYAAAKATPPTVASDDAAPAWFRQTVEATRKARSAKYPDWLWDVQHPPVDLEGWYASSSEINSIVSALQQCTADNIHPLISELRNHNQEFTLDEFAWDLFERWIAQGHPAKEKWAMLSVGLLGSDQLVCRLLPIMIKWREDNYADRAKFGLECMRARGSDVALARIHEIGQNARLKSLNGKAIEVMGKIAQDRGLTKEQLEDRIVPSCGLNDKGTRIFDYGDRKFEFVFGADLKAMVRDENGQRKSDLPAPTQKDDAQMAAKAQAQWKELKKELKSVAKIQAGRLEQAMITGRRWSYAEYSQFLLHHPLMRNLIRTMIWGCFDTDGELIKTFRVNDDGDFADHDDRAVPIEEAAYIGIVHPFNLADEQKSGWGEMLADYEIVPLFPQLGRPIHLLEPEEQNRNSIMRFKETEVQATAVSGTLERLGWIRGAASDGARYYEHCKQFYAINITAVIRYEPGIVMMMMSESEPQCIEEIYFVQGLVKPDYFSDAEKLPLCMVHPIVISEVIADAMQVTAKAK